MPIAIQCDCGKSLRVKDELAGKKVRCPGCKDVLSVPAPELSTEDEALSELMAEEPASKMETSFQQEEPPPRTYSKPSPPPRRDRDEEYEAPKPRKKRLNPMSREDRERARPASTGGGLVVNGSIITGCLMMLGAVVWFFGGLAAGYIFFYPPILFVLGIAAVFRGFTGREE